MTAKAIEHDEEVLGYEIVDGRPSPMDRERYLAFIQEGINSGERDGWIPHDEAMARIRERLKKPAAA